MKKQEKISQALLKYAYVDYTRGRRSDEKVRSDSQGEKRPEYSKAKEKLINLYEQRWEEGLDIWPGKPLDGAGLQDWENQNDYLERKAKKNA